MIPSARNPEEFYAVVETASDINDRLKIFVQEYVRHRDRLGRQINVLDIGCGRRALLSGPVRNRGDAYTGVDIAPPNKELDIRYEVVDLNNQSLKDRFGEERFDLVFCGEVIEHLFSPDVLMEDVFQLLTPDGIVILSTPNLAYWMNRLLLILGISPLFLENSSRKKLGRRFRFLGQGNSTEGHIRLFTFRALTEFVRLCGFEPVRRTAAAVWANPIDRLIARVRPQLAPVLIFILKPSGGR